MQNRQTAETRVFAKKTARVLSYREVDTIAGGFHQGGCMLTYCYFEDNHDDASPGCDIP